MFRGISTIKLIALAVAAAAIIGFVLLAFHWKDQAADRKERLAIICKATREASDNPKLGCGNVVMQIGEIGASLKNTTAALERQNAAVGALGAENKRQAALLADAKRQADKRAEKPEATSKRLDASSRDPARQTKPCEPSKALEETWR